MHILRRVQMAKCLTCGTVNPEENVYCAKCGTKLIGSTKSATDAAYEEAQKEFEKDALIAMNKDKIVYTCLICGTVNRIENEVCSKCGKKRPRNEFVSALRRIQEGRAAQEEYAAEQKAAAAEAEAAPVQPVPDEPIQEKKYTLYKYVEMPRQMPPTVQPFVIVPYVNPQQPLWQYRPNQVYRFQPFTYEERLIAERNALAAQKGAPPTEEELLRIRSQVDNDLKALGGNKQGKAKGGNGKKAVRAGALLSLLISVAAIVLFFLTSLSSTIDLKGIGYASALIACINGAFGTDISFGDAAYTYSGAASFVIPLGAIIIVLISAGIAIASIVKLATGRAKCKGFVAPLIALLIAIAVAITMISVSGFGFNDIAGFFGDVGIGCYAMIAAPLALFIIGLAFPKNPKTAKPQ
jgi:ribosomal protein L40E